MIGNKNFLRLGVICFAGIVLFLTFNRHSKSGYFNYHSEIWSDKAGYHVYLPALKYGFNADRFPDSIDQKTGGGFILDHANKKVLTKYTCGVAILQLPFFIIAELSARPLHFEANGYSPIYQKIIDVAAVCYLLLGLYFLGRYLAGRFTVSVSLIVLASVFLATPLYYYSIAETGMSHIYSFAAFCAWIFLVDRTSFLKSSNLLQLLLFGALSGLIVLIRPSNVLFLSAYLFLDIETKDGIRGRLKTILQPKVLLPVLASALIVVVPQFAYWYYAYGSVFKYSYGSEGFNWADPHLLHTWFAPRNGLFTYTPFFLIVAGTMIKMATNRIMNGYFLLVLFLVISLVFSCWHDWGFGCAYGARSYVEYLALFSIPVAQLVSVLYRSKKMKFVGFLSLILIFAVINLKMIYTYDGCFPGTTDWDWGAYLNLILSPPK